MKFIEIINIEELDILKSDYMNGITSPLDGMWSTGFVPQAKHYGIYGNDKLIGYFCINGDGYILQYNLDELLKYQMSDVFKLILESKSNSVGVINGAFCSTAEPAFLSVCLDHFLEHKVNALMYKENPILKDEAEGIDLSLLDTNDLARVVGFVHQAIGAPVDWLKMYLNNLIERRELYAYFLNENIVATGECRKFDKYQIDCADLGVIVSSQYRRKGVATSVLKGLKNIARSNELLSMCSTESENIGAQKAITQAGFISDNRIIQFR